MNHHLQATIQKAALHTPTVAICIIILHMLMTISPYKHCIWHFFSCVTRINAKDHLFFIRVFIVWEFHKNDKGRSGPKGAWVTLARYSVIPWFRWGIAEFRIVNHRILNRKLKNLTPLYGWLGSLSYDDFSAEYVCICGDNFSSSLYS